MSLNIEIIETEEEKSFHTMYDDFLSFKRKHNLSKKDINLLIEAYRRRMMFDRDVPIRKAWVGLGTPSQYKSELFVPLGNPIPRYKNWFLFSEKGIEIFLIFLKEFPFPPVEKQQTLNSFLFEIHL